MKRVERSGPTAARSDWVARLMLVGIASFAFLACAPTIFSEGKRAHREGNDAEAVRLLHLALSQRPGDPERNRELGIACFGVQDYDCAAEHLGIADQRKVMNGEAFYCLGATHERLGDTTSALTTYSRYWEVSRLSHFRRMMVRRVRELVRTQVSPQDHIEGHVPDNTLAVFRIQTISDSEPLQPIGIGLTDWVMTDLQYVKALTVLERLRIDRILEELDFAQSETLDPSTIPRLGRTLGARHIIFGTVLDQGAERIRVDLFAHDALGEKGEVSVSAEGAILDVFSLEKVLVFDLLDRMGVSLTAMERQKIERIPTRSLSAFLAYSQAIEHEWAGRDEEAEDLFKQTIIDDPMFDQTTPAAAEGEASRSEETIDNVTGDLIPDDPEDARGDPPEMQPLIPAPPSPPGWDDGIPPPPPPPTRYPGGAR